MNKKFVSPFAIGLLLSLSPVAVAAKIVTRTVTTESDCGSKVECNKKIEEALKSCPPNYTLNRTSSGNNTTTIECLPIVPSLPEPARGDDGMSSLEIVSVMRGGYPYWVVSGCPTGMPTLRQRHVRPDGWTVFQAVCLAPGNRIQNGMVIPADKRSRPWPVYHDALGCFSLDTREGRNPESWPSNAHGEHSDSGRHLTFNAEVQPTSCKAPVAKPAPKRAPAARPTAKKAAQRAKR